MVSNSKCESFRQVANGVDFYCEKRGQGPTVVLVPAADGDAGGFALVAQALSDRFTVFTFDLRGCSRSGKPAGGMKPVTAKEGAEDVAALVKACNLAPASFYGCSMSGQTILHVGLYHPEIVRNLMVHEVALLNESPIPGAAEMGFRMILAKFEKKLGSRNAAVRALGASLASDPEAQKAPVEDYAKRSHNNGETWLDYYFGTIDQPTYTAEQLEKLPPVIFTVGLLSPAWLVEGNLKTARRGNKEVVWLPCAHVPNITIPDLLAKFIGEQVQRYL